MLRQKARRGSEDLSEGIRRIRRGFPEEEPSATAVCIDEGRGISAASLFVFFVCHHRVASIIPFVL